MDVPEYFISCDWGTTNFRLRVAETESLVVLAEHSTDVGVRELNEQFTKSEATDRMAFYLTYLRTQLGALPAKYRKHPIVVSGMASANIGMRDLPYGELPIEAEALSFLIVDFTLAPGQRLRLVSGIKSTNGMMRGEETQALGLLVTMASHAEGVLLLPGTHCKHLKFTGESFTDFTSYMTGELFEIISRRSILSNSVASGAWNDRRGGCFRDGVRDGYENGFSPHLFSIRARHVLGGTDKTDNFYYLSGLLIGDELSHLPRSQTLEIYLAGAGPLMRLYRSALEILGHGQRLTVYEDKVLSEALLVGQRLLLRKP